MLLFSGVIIQVGWTPLIHAEINGNFDVVTELISLGANVDIQAIVSHFLMSHDTTKFVYDFQT